MVASACAASVAVATESAEKPPCVRPFFSKTTSSSLSSTRRTLIPCGPPFRLVDLRPILAWLAFSRGLLGLHLKGDAFRRTSGPRRPPPAPAPARAAAGRRTRAHDPGVPARGVGLHRDVARLSAEALRCDARDRH